MDVDMKAELSRDQLRAAAQLGAATGVGSTQVHQVAGR
jgi:hypothetical protein